ncbi:MAG: repeat protein [Chitinophagaceae bacterium]|nr:repeat protein [Chitinophagaceae bacterium]
MVFKSVLITGYISLHCAINGNGQSFFASQVIDSTITIGYGLSLADVDGDGKTDILLADKKQFVWYRNGDWKKFLMAENLTEQDNVCITARDIDGDGKAEVAVGAQWNPGETSNDEQSGAVYYLIRPVDPTQLWKPVKLHHEPTVHRMQWVRSNTGKFYLVVAPLHGRGNKNGEGTGSKILAYHFSANPESEWTIDTLEGDMHLTHNFFRIEKTNGYNLYVAGKEGIMLLQESGKQMIRNKLPLEGMNRGAGEVVVGKLSNAENFLAAIEPMHGNELAVYIHNYAVRILLDSSLKEGHAIGSADFLHRGSDQLLAGWRMPDKQGKVGIKLYAPKDKDGKNWESFWVDENGMACEDLKIADLNADGKPDIVASGRATRNVKIYWGR